MPPVFSRTSSGISKAPSPFHGGVHESPSTSVGILSVATSRAVIPVACRVRMLLVERPWVHLTASPAKTAPVAVQVADAVASLDLCFGKRAEARIGPPWTAESTFAGTGSSTKHGEMRRSFMVEQGTRSWQQNCGTIKVVSFGMSAYGDHVHFWKQEMNQYGLLLCSMMFNVQLGVTWVTTQMLPSWNC